MFQAFKTFRADEDGAVTVDWVVLTAAIVGLGVVVVTTVSEGAIDHTNTLNSHLQTQDVTLAYGE